MEEKSSKGKFDSFEALPVQSLTLDQLEQTHRENYPDGSPVGGIYHFDLIHRILDMLDEKHLEWNIKEIFAANNKFKRSPGVTILPEVEKINGVGSLESHILRRVFCNINIMGGLATEEMTYNIAVSYTQYGILVGFGPYVFACHNQCICSADSVISNYTLRGRDRLSSLDRQTESLLSMIEHNISILPKRYDEDINSLNWLKDIILTEAEIMQFIGFLVQERCRCTSPNPLVRENRVAPLDSAQINSFCEKILETAAGQVPSAFDLYQIGTNMMKPAVMPFENLCPQSFALFDSLKNYIQRIHGI